MGTVAKIAVSVDRATLREVERLRETTGESRSAFVSRALRRLIAEHEMQDRIAAYVDGYRRMPEQPVEVDAARDLARRSLESLEWDLT
jgi:metal-responsive CopG/Arc/MetJ family transcriptional regulator